MASVRRPWRMVTGAMLGFVLGALYTLGRGRMSVGLPAVGAVAGIVVGLGVDLYEGWRRSRQRGR